MCVCGGGLVVVVVRGVCGGVECLECLECVCGFTVGRNIFRLCSDKIIIVCRT